MADNAPSTSANVRVATQAQAMREGQIFLQPVPTCELQHDGGQGGRKRQAFNQCQRASCNHDVSDSRFAGDPSTSANVRVATAKMHKTLTMHGLLCAS